MENEPLNTNPDMTPEPMVTPTAPEDKPLKKPSVGAVWLLVIVVVIIGLIVIFSRMQKPADQTVANTNNGIVPPQPQTLCYYGAGVASTGAKERYALKVDIAGASATGELMTAPPERDKMSGTLSGMIIPGAPGETVFDGTYSNEAEGMKNVDERVIRLGETQALIGYGDMTQNPDGSYSYTDKNKINFSLKIPRVDCGLYDTAMAQ